MRKTAENKKKELTLADVLLSCFINALISFSVFLLLSIFINALSATSTYIKENSRIILFCALGVSCIVNGALNAIRLKIKAVISSSASALFFITLLLIYYALIGGFGFGINSIISVIISLSVTVISAIIFKNLRR